MKPYFLSTKRSNQTNKITFITAGREAWSSRQVDLSLFLSFIVWSVFIYYPLQHNTAQHILFPQHHFPSSNTTLSLSLFLSLTAPPDSGSDLRSPPHRETSFQTQNPDPSHSPHHDRHSVSHRVDHLLQLRLALRLRPVQGFLPQNLRLVQLQQSSGPSYRPFLFIPYIYTIILVIIPMRWFSGLRTDLLRARRFLHSPFVSSHSGFYFVSLFAS